MGASSSNNDSINTRRQNGKAKEKESQNLIRMIKSPEILKLVFSDIIKNKELDIIKYNKNIQKQFNYNTEYYKQKSKGYIIGKRNGEGNEYNEYDELIFEREYLNGKGKEYDEEEKIIFEREYLNGRRNGKGKEYDEEEKVIFKGVYKNGGKNGKGKEYDDKGNLTFEGKYLNGMRWNGKGYNNKTLEYEIRNFNEKVKEYQINPRSSFRAIYEGEYINEQKLE